jgi:hypothetical protein
MNCLVERKCYDTFPTKSIIRILGLTLLIPLVVEQSQFAHGFAASSSSSSVPNKVSSKEATATTTTTYNYFAIGSNMVPSTMTSLRNLSPISATAAILPNYTLRFNIRGNPFIEPSAASVMKQPQPQQHTTASTTFNDPCTNNSVHGVLYTLTEDDFARLGQSEGVPFAYVWERCYPIPYIGNNNDAGHMVLSQYRIHTSTTNDRTIYVSDDENGERSTQQQQSQQEIQEAFVLTASTIFTSDSKTQQDIPPSKSYLQLLQDGSKYWNMDVTYQTYLQNVNTNPIVCGISKQILQLAEQINPKPSLFIPTQTNVESS